MKDKMQYKGYTGSVLYSDEDQTLYGKIENIQSLISYEATDVAALKQAFAEAVDDYLDLCAQQGHEPEKPFKGTFNVRTSSELHRQAALLARDKSMNLNRLVTEALKEYLARS